MQPESVQALLKYCHIKKYKKKECIFPYGDQCKSLYYIIDGQVGINMPDLQYQNKDVVIDFIGRHEFFGIEGFFNKNSLPYTITALDHCTIAEISYLKLRTILDRDLSNYSVELLIILSQRLSESIDWSRVNFYNHIYGDIDDRVYAALLFLCKKPSAMTHPDGMQIKVKTVELCNIIGVCRERIGNSFKSLMEKGLIYREGICRDIVLIGVR